MIEIKLPFKTPTINHLYYHVKNLKILTKEARELKKQIKEQIQALEINTAPYLNQLLDLSIEVHEDWYTKKGDVKRKDLQNREKFLNDSVFEALGMEDKFIFKHQMQKIQDDKEYSIIKIKLLNTQSQKNRKV